MDLYQVVLMSVAVLAVPGAVLGWVSGLKLPWALASALPINFGVIGLAAWILGQWERSFNLTSYFLVFAGFLVLAVVWRLGFVIVRRLRSRRLTYVDEEPAGLIASSRAGGILDPRWIIPAAGVLTSVYLFFRKSFDFFDFFPENLENIPQGWDVHWHGAMVRWIMDNGVADPTRMGELRNLESLGHLFYPSGWHAAAALAAESTGLTAIAAINVANVIIPGLLLPLSVAMIAWKMVGNGGLTAQIGAAIAAIAVFGSPVLYWIGTYVGAWPYLAAISATGIVLALFMHVPYRPLAAFPAALAFAGMVQIHPSSVTIVVVALLLWWLLYLVWAPSRKAETPLGKLGARLRDLGWLGLAGVVGTGILLPQLLSGTEATEEVAEFTAFEDVTREESWVRSFLMETRHTDMFSDVDLTIALVAAGIGAAVIIFWRRNLWAPAFYLLTVWMTANSMMPFEDPWYDRLNLIAGLHYSTPHRLIMAAAMFLFAAAGIGVAAVIRLIALGPVKKFALWSTIASVILGVAAGGYTVAWATSDELMEGAEWAVNSPRADTRMVSEIDLKAFDWLAEQPKAYDGLIMGEPADGHGWMYAYNGLPSLNRHYQWPDAPGGTATDIAFWHADLLGAGTEEDPLAPNPVDEAAAELNLTYYYVSPPSFWAFQIPNEKINSGLWTTPGVTPVYLDHNVSIFAVNQAFTDEELLEIREPGNSPAPLPPLPVDENGNPYFHRPAPVVSSAAQP